MILTIFLSAAVLLLIAAREREPRLRLPELPGLVSGIGDSAVWARGDRSNRVLLTLWSSDDAVSRLSNIYYSALARRTDGVVHIGVNFDESPAMYREVLRLDRPDSSSVQYRVDGSRAQDLRLQFGPGFNTFLIDSAGRVLARNPRELSGE